MQDGHGKRPPQDEAERALRARMADALRAFQAKNPETKTVSGLADATGVNEDTLSRLLRGLQTPSQTSRQRLYEATNAEVFRGKPQERAAKGSSPAPPARANGIQDLVHEVRTLSTRVEELTRSVSQGPAARTGRGNVGEQPTVRMRAQNVAQILGDLDRELAFFREVTRRDARHVLRKVVDAKDVGYLIALLKAMYDDDAFENWVFGAQYATSRS